MHPLKKYRGFNTSYYRKKANIINRKHEEAKDRLANIAILMGYKVDREIEFPKSIKVMGMYWPYKVDIFAHDNPGKQDLILEADGQSHERRRYKDNRRDAYFREYEGIQTIRFPLEYVVGPDAVGDHKIKYRIIHGSWPYHRMPDDEIIRQIS